MYLGGKFYSLHVKHNLRDLDQGLDNVDHHLLDKYIFNLFSELMIMRKKKTAK